MTAPSSPSVVTEGLREKLINAITEIWKDMAVRAGAEYADTQIMSDPYGQTTMRLRARLPAQLDRKVFMFDAALDSMAIGVGAVKDKDFIRKSIERVVMTAKAEVEKLITQEQLRVIGDMAKRSSFKNPYAGYGDWSEQRIPEYRYRPDGSVEVSFPPAPVLRPVLQDNDPEVEALRKANTMLREMNENQRRTIADLRGELKAALAEIERTRLNVQAAPRNRILLVEEFQ